jgi:hypothetical protein
LARAATLAILSSPTPSSRNVAPRSSITASTWPSSSPLGDQVRVAPAHVHAGVVVGAAGDHRQEPLLLGRLPLHVDPVEEVGDTVVAQDLAVKDVDRGLDGGSAAQFIIQARHDVYLRL